MKASVYELISNNTKSIPRFLISWSMALATISRGANSALASNWCMKGEPSGKINLPALASYASLIRKRLGMWMI